MHGTDNRVIFGEDNALTLSGNLSLYDLNTLGFAGGAISADALNIDTVSMPKTKPSFRGML